MGTLVDHVTPVLWRACLAGDVQQIEQQMFTRRADPHLVDRNGETCLHMAARSGQAAAVTRLLEEGLSVDQANNNGQTPLHIAVNLGHLDVVMTIAQHGANLDVPTKFSGMTPLHLACRHGWEDIVQILLDSGANCAIKDQIQKWPDFYTSNVTILKAFDRHFDVCTHGRGRLKGDTGDTSTAVSKGQGLTPSVARNAAGVAVLDDSIEIDNAKARSTRDRGGPQYGELDHGNVTIFDQDAEYDPNGQRPGEGVIQRVGKKLQLNHKMDFSDQHKRRMQQNVFDRLLGPSKKK